MERIFETILTAIQSHPKRPLRVAIDGGSASGKTTLANRLGQELGCPVVHMDDFFLPPTLRSEDRLNQPGGNVHYERFASEVLPGLKTGTGFSYGVFDCSTMAVTHRRTVAPSEIVIVEGAYSLHPALAEAYDLKIFLQVPPALQSARILHRNGAEKQAVFLAKWIPLEHRYFTACKVKDRADLVLEIPE